MWGECVGSVWGVRVTFRATFALFFDRREGEERPAEMDRARENRPGLLPVMRWRHDPP